jgi:hypothetical protein
MFRSALKSGGLRPRLVQGEREEDLADVIANVPKDAGGDRLNILQDNPIMTDDLIGAADIAELELGIRGSDPYLFVKGCGGAGWIAVRARKHPPRPPRPIRYRAVAAPVQREPLRYLFNGGHEIT